MRIVRHCSEHLQHGERMWRRAARLAGFTGTLYVTGIGASKWSREELHYDRRARYGVTVGRFSPPSTITVLLPDTHAACARGRERNRLEDRLLTFCHELYHWKRDGRTDGVDTTKMTMAKWRENPQERAAERYARWLMRAL